jgi:hypothetical protein
MTSIIWYPKKKAGKGSFDNGILLCVRCHDMYGHRKDKRLQLRQARDAWYEYVEQRYSTSDVQVFENLATKDDINEIKSKISDIYDTVMKEIDSSRYSRDDAANFASTMFLHWWRTRPLSRCGSTILMRRPSSADRSSRKTNPRDLTYQGWPKTVGSQYQFSNARLWRFHVAGDRRTSANGCSAPWLRVDRQMPVNKFQPFLHAGQAEPAPCGRLG